MTTEEVSQGTHRADDDGAFSFDPSDNVLRVKSSSEVASLAQVLAKLVYEGHAPRLRAIGASAVNQAVKATAVARGYTAARGIDLTFRTGFEEVAGNNGTPISAVVLSTVVHR